MSRDSTVIVLYFWDKMKVTSALIISGNKEVSTDNFSVMSRRYPGKFLAPMLHLSRRQRVSRNASPTIMSANERKPLQPYLKSLL